MLKLLRKRKIFKKKILLTGLVIGFLMGLTYFIDSTNNVGAEDVLSNKSPITAVKAVEGKDYSIIIHSSFFEETLPNFCLIDWGDGQVTQDPNCDSFDGFPNGNYQYNHPNGFYQCNDPDEEGFCTYKMTLSTSPDDQIFDEIQVADVHPRITNIEMQDAVIEGYTHGITFNFEESSVDNVVSCKVDWGDGEIEIYPVQDCGIHTHKYKDEGKYSITVITTDEDSTSELSREVIVEESYPIVEVLRDNETDKYYGIEDDFYVIRMKRNSPDHDSLRHCKINWGANNITEDKNCENADSIKTDLSDGKSIYFYMYKIEDYKCDQPDNSCEPSITVIVSDEDGQKSIETKDLKELCSRHYSIIEGIDCSANPPFPVSKSSLESLLDLQSMLIDSTPLTKIELNKLETDKTYQLQFEN